MSANAPAPRRRRDRRLHRPTPRRLRWPDLTEEQILRWADAHHARTGEWPATNSGQIYDAPRENWAAVNGALHDGHRGLPGGSSLARLLAEQRGVRNRMALPHLSEEQILAWADAHHERTGQWPTLHSGPVEEAPGETWEGIHGALYQGCRGLPGGSSLPRLLARHRGVRNLQDLPPLTAEQILAWADAHHARTGQWPKRESGPVADAPGERWHNVDAALKRGTRGLPPGSSLAELLARQRGVRYHLGRPRLTEEQILAWADAHYQETGRWPTKDAGPVAGTVDETWAAVDAALVAGTRGLPGGSSLARLLAKHRGVRNPKGLPPLTVEQILAWADLHYQRTGTWPAHPSGPVPEAPGETWGGIHEALAKGHRGLPGGSSLARLLSDHRGVRNQAALPPFMEEQILSWADAHHARTGQWPNRNSGPIAGGAGDTWFAVDKALARGYRGLPGGSSLARFLAARRGVRNIHSLPRLTPEQILAWADAHRERTGSWPNNDSGPVAAAPDETWAAIDMALRMGARGLPSGSSLARLLAQERGTRNRKALPPFTEEQILAWADAYHTRFGRWPAERSGPIAEAPGETWAAVDAALSAGARGLPGGSSLARLLAEHRGARNIHTLAPLTAEQILEWADAHHARTGRWPNLNSGPVQEAPGESWRAIQVALTHGARGLPGGTSLARLLAAERGVRNPKNLPPLSVEQILAWAEAHYERAGECPKRTSGSIQEAPGETWSAVDTALCQGNRGLPGGSSLSKLLREYGKTGG
jgi:hypothetical protein